MVCSANLDAEDKSKSRMDKLMHLTSSLKVISASHKDAPVFVGCDLGNGTRGGEYHSIQNGRAFLKKNKDVPKGYEEGFGMGLKSAYHQAYYGSKGKNLEPVSTMFGCREGARDFLFFEEARGVTCPAVLHLPSDTEVQQHKAYPNWQVPSVHYPLMAQFYL